jgi:hypothetical protein
MFRRENVRKVENRTAAHRCIDLTAAATALNTSNVKHVSITVKSLTSIMSIARANPIVAMDVCLKLLSMFCLDRLCGLVVKVLGYRSGGPGSIPGTTRGKKVVGLERGPLRLVSITEELLDRKVAAPV